MSKVINDIDTEIKLLKSKRRHLMLLDRLDNKTVSPKSKAHPLIKNLVTARKRLGIDQTLVAKHLGVTRQTISNIEHGKQTITFDHFLAYNEVVKYYDITLRLEPEFKPEGIVEGRYIG